MDKCGPFRRLFSQGDRAQVVADEGGLANFLEMSLAAARLPLYYVQGYIELGQRGGK